MRTIYIEDDASELLAEAIKVAQMPLKLELKSNVIRCDGVEFFAEAIKVAQVPLTLGLSDNYIGVHGIKFLAGAIKAARFPLILDLRHNNIGLYYAPDDCEDCKYDYTEEDNGAVFLAEAIKEALVPITLHLGSNKIRDAGAKAFAEALKAARVPINLNLSANYIGEAGVKALAEGIKEVQFPLTLDLSSNSEKAGALYSIQRVSTEAIAEAIKEAQYSIALVFSSNDIPDAKPLAEALKAARAPITLGCKRMRGVYGFVETIKEARVPLTLDLSSNKIGDVGAWFFAEAIECAMVPLNLNLSYNDIGDIGVARLASAIKVARVPLILDLSSNSIGEAAFEVLAEAIKAARVPLTLDVQLNSYSSHYLVDKGQELLNYAREDNFIIEARSNPLKFLSRIKFSPIMRMLEQGSDLPYVLVDLVQGYIGYEDLAWAEVAAIRAVEGASIDNKYASINYELLTAAYTPMVAVALVPDDEQILDDDQENRRILSSISSSLQSQVLNLLLLLSRIKALSNRLETPQGYVDVPGDGLCFYHAISSQLGGNVYSALELQQMAINEIINHLDRYEEFAAQYGGGLDGFLNYHLQRQDSEKGGWADNIMIQALANALERVIEVQLFDRAGNAIGAGPVIINPHHVANPNALRLGNIEDLHFIAAEEVSSSSTSLEEEQAYIARPLKRKQAFAEDSKTHKAARAIQEDEVAAPKEDEGDPCEEEIDWDQYRCEVQDHDFAPTPSHTPAVISGDAYTPNSTSQVYYETLEFGDASSFELVATLMLGGVDSIASNI